MRFQGREMSQMDTGREVMQKLAAPLGDVAVVEAEPKMKAVKCS